MTMSRIFISATSLCFLSLLCFTTNQLTFAIRPHLANFQTPSINSVRTIHDLLPQFGFPKGLLPDAVKSYSLSDNGDFEIELEHPCYVQFQNLVFYDKKINGKLKFGAIYDVSGIQAKKLFVWVSVSEIEVDSESGLIEFHAGVFTEKLPAEQFESIPTCKSKACKGSEPVSSLISEV